MTRHLVRRAADVQEPSYDEHGYRRRELVGEDDGSVEGESVELLEPGEVAEYRIRCYPMANVFRRGHRIRVDVTSSSFPRFSRNLNTGEDVGTGTRMEVAEQTILHADRYPSHVLLPVTAS